MFSWGTQESIRNYEKHGTPFEEVSTVFSDPDALDWDDLSHSHTEPRFRRVGRSVTDRILLAIYRLGE